MPVRRTIELRSDVLPLLPALDQIYHCPMDPVFFGDIQLDARVIPYRDDLLFCQAGVGIVLAKAIPPVLGFAITLIVGSGS